MKALFLIAAFYAFCALIGIIAWARRYHAPRHRALHLDRDSDWE